MCPCCISICSSCISICVLVYVLINLMKKTTMIVTISLNHYLDNESIKRYYSLLVDGMLCPEKENKSHKNLGYIVKE